MEKLREILLDSEKPSAYFEELRRNDSLYPELAALIGVPQNRKYHLEGDVWTHTMLVLDEAAKRRDIVKNPLGFMLSALCHDFGKAVSTVETDGVVHSFYHEIDGLPIVRGFLESIGAEQELADYVLNMTELHMEPNIMAAAKSKLKKTNRLFDDSVEPFDLIQLGICDGLGKIPQNDSSEDFLMERYETFKKIMSRPYVTERDISEAGINAGDKMPELLSYAHKLRLAGCDKDNTLRQCRAYAEKVLKKEG
ncbi:MAG: hypothetical protein K5979_04220 [Ruminococcus sp.]|nr:hypothetical protein [Ruminococcus sp.]